MGQAAADPRPQIIHITWADGLTSEVELPDFDINTQAIQLARFSHPTILRRREGEGYRFFEDTTAFNILRGIQPIIQ